MTIKAIFENGIFRPLKPVALPERSTVEFEPKIVTEQDDNRAAQEEIYKLLSKSFASGETDVAARHNEHQP